MGRKRSASLLKRHNTGLSVKKNKKRGKDGPTSAASVPASKGAAGIRSNAPGSKPRGSKAAARAGGKRFKPWLPASVVHRQAAHALGVLVSAAQRGEGGAGIKSLTLTPGIEAKRATHAVTCECLRHLALIREVIARTGLLDATLRLDEHAAQVLVYDLLLGQPPRPVGPAERAVLAHHEALRSAMTDVLRESGCASPAEHAAAARATGDKHVPAQRGTGTPVPRPRSVRVNVLLTTMEEAAAELAGEGYKHAKPDPLLPHVLLLPPRADLHAAAGVHTGRLVLQSRASCMTAAALRPPPGAALLDACAAPGNKTTQLAALLGGKGSVLALDRDPARAARLQASVRAAGAQDCVTVRCADFLQLDPAEYAHIQGILLDPSCSGSGTAAADVDASLRGAGIVFRGGRRGEHGQGKRKSAGTGDAFIDVTEGAFIGATEDASSTAVDASNDDDSHAQPTTNPRIEALARFQEAALRHALLFPGLQRLAYSTCSVHVRENEAVVAAVLPQAQAAGMELAPALPDWPRRGIPGTVPGAELLLRTDPVEDGTDGFFVALFQRTDLDPAWR